jgi:hypothetical protein
VVLAACGGGPPDAGVANLGPGTTTATGPAGGSSNARGSTNAQSSSSQMLPFANCMRSKGVRSFPDPNSSGKFPDAHQLGVSTSQYQAAMHTCQHLLPNGGHSPSRAEFQLEMTALLPFSRCMQSHGAPEWPDPSIYTNADGETAVVFDFIGTSLNGNGFDSPRVQAEIKVCQHLLPSRYGGAAFRIVRSNR